MRAIASRPIGVTRLKPFPLFTVNTPHAEHHTRIFNERVGVPAQRQLTREPRASCCGVFGATGAHAACGAIPRHAAVGVGIFYD
jgi:hypothetical protein